MCVMNSIKINNVTAVNVDKKVGISNELISNRATWDAFTKVNGANNLFYVRGWMHYLTKYITFTPDTDSEILLFIDVEKEISNNNKILIERPLNVNNNVCLYHFYTSDFQPINISINDDSLDFPVGKYYVDIPEDDSIKYFVYFICHDYRSEIGLTKIKVVNEKELLDLSNKNYAINFYNVDTRPSKLNDALTTRRLWYNVDNMSNVEIVNYSYFAKNYNYIRNTQESSEHYSN